jgi:hypothetical protein
MSRYTTQVRYICESEAGLSESTEFSGIQNTITQAIPKVFNFDFPIFDESYREPLCRKILSQYWTREISEETYGLWKLRLYTKLNRIMPYYNQLYKSELILFNPMYEVDLKRDWTKTADGYSNNTTSVSVTASGSNENLEIKDIDETVNFDSDNKKVSSSNTENSETSNKDVDTTSKEDYTSEVRNGSTNQTDTTTHSEDESKKDSRFADTPQGSIADLENGRYLTNATIDETNSITDGESTVKSKIVGDSSTTDETKITSSVKEEGKVNSNSDVTGNEDINVNSKNVTDGKITTSNNGSFNSANGSNTNYHETGNDIETYFEKVQGKQSNASYSKLLVEFRQTFLNIDEMILKELNELFYGIYDIW